MKPSYETFEKCFLNYECEMSVSIGEYVVSFLDAPKISPVAACACVRVLPKKWTFRSILRWFFNKCIIFEQVYSTREELIKNFIFNGKTVRDIWNEGEPSIEI